MPRSGLDQDFHMRQVKYYLQTTRYHKETQNNQKNGIRKISRSFVLQDGVMYYNGKQQNEYREVIMGRDRRQRILQECHIDKDGHHRGQKSMRDVINRTYYWQTIVHDIQDYIKSCGFCLNNRVPKPKVEGEKMTASSRGPYQQVDGALPNISNSLHMQCFAAKKIQEYNQETVEVSSDDTLICVGELSGNEKFDIIPTTVADEADRLVGYHGYKAGALWDTPLIHVQHPKSISERVEDSDIRIDNYKPHVNEPTPNSVCSGSAYTAVETSAPEVEPAKHTPNPKKDWMRRLKKSRFQDRQVQTDSYTQEVFPNKSAGITCGQNVLPCPWVRQALPTMSGNKADKDHTENKPHRHVQGGIKKKRRLNSKKKSSDVRVMLSRLWYLWALLFSSKTTKVSSEQADHIFPDTDDLHMEFQKLYARLLDIHNVADDNPWIRAKLNRNNDNYDSISSSSYFRDCNLNRSKIKQETDSSNGDEGDTYTNKIQTQRSREQ